MIHTYAMIPLPNTHISTVVLEAVATANRLDVPVTCRFNGTVLIAMPCDNSAAVLEAWSEDNTSQQRQRKGYSI